MKAEKAEMVAVAVYRHDTVEVLVLEQGGL